MMLLAPACGSADSTSVSPPTDRVRLGIDGFDQTTHAGATVPTIVLDDASGPEASSPVTSKRVGGILSSVALITWPHPRGDSSVRQPHARAQPQVPLVHLYGALHALAPAQHG